MEDQISVNQDAFESGQKAAQNGQGLRDLPPYDDDYLAESWRSGWWYSIVSEVEAGQEQSAVVEVARLRSIIKTMAAMAYSVGEVGAGPDGPQVVFMCRICGMLFRSEKQDTQHHPGCPLGQYAPPIADYYMDVIHCARCGKDHLHMAFYALEGDAISTNQGPARYWSMCPNLHEPLLLAVVPDRCTIPDSPYYPVEPGDHNM